MTKKEYINDTKRMVKVMNGNHFLLPRTWSDYMDVDLHDWSYRTYCSDSSTSENLYVVVEIKKEDEKVFDFHFIGEEIRVSSSIDKPVSPEEMHEYIRTIYNEKHSFSEHHEGLKSLRKKVRDQKSKITLARREIERLENQIKGLKDLSKSN